jgi:proton-translocating NADH-quinone oxidoreductase, chain N
MTDTMTLHGLLPVLPEIVLAVSAMALLMFGAAGGERSGGLINTSSILVLVAVFGIIASQPDGREVLFGGSFVVDDYARFLKMLAVAGSAGALLLSLDYLTQGRQQKFEYGVLFLLSTLGMMMLISAEDLIALYLGLELMSLALYVVAAFDRDNTRSSEAGLKYFVLGALSSGMLLYGASLIYGFTGTINFIGIAKATTAGASIGLIFGLVFLFVGFCFKVSAVPFHMWTPDVYQGAPTAVTAFMAVASKAASFAAFLRVFVEGLGGFKADWSDLFVLLAVLTLVLGNVVAIVQTNIKRMLAYSSIAHAGYALIGLVAAGRSAGESGGTSGIASVMLYLTFYAFMTLGAFALIAMFRKGGLEGDEIEDFAGLAKRQPLAAFVMMVFMVSLTGIPPTAGFIGKFYVFMAAVEAGLSWLAVVALIFSAVSAYYYMRVVMLMYMREPEVSAAEASHLVPSPALSIVLACAVAGVIIFGLFPTPVVSLALQSVLLLK